MLYEIGYLNPSLIAGYVEEFTDLLGSKHNRLVWGGMIALATISPLKPGAIGKRLDDVIRAVEAGSLITVVWGVKVLAAVAAAEHPRRPKILPVLKRVLKTCLPRDVPMHAESILTVLEAANHRPFLAILTAREAELSAAQAGRLRKTLRRLGVASAGKQVAKSERREGEAGRR